MAANSNRLSNIPVWIENGVDDFNVATLPYPGALGAVWTKNGKTYQIVQNGTTSATLAVDDAVAWLDMDDFTITKDVSDAGRNRPAGVALDVNEVDKYCVIQVAGPGTVNFSQGTTVGGTDAANDETAILSATDGGVDRVAVGTASTYVPFGIFTAADTGGTGAVVYITCPHNGW